MITSRRSFLTGLGAALIVAPAIVRAGSLMPVKQMPVIGDGVALWALSHPVMVPVITKMDGLVRWNQQFGSEWMDTAILRHASAGSQIVGVVSQWAIGLDGTRFFPGDVVAIA